jgi:hypothetical protein
VPAAAHLQQTNTAEAVRLPCPAHHCTALDASSRFSFVTHVDFEPVKLRLPGRKNAAETPDAPSADPSSDLTEQLTRAAGKGRPTPKRNVAQGRRPGPPPPPPTTRKEAYKRMRETQASRRAETRQGMARGDEAYLPARDRGPVRKLVRDIVDSRRNVGSFFLAIAGVALIGVVVPNIVVRNYTSFLMIGFFALLFVDSFVLSRKIKRAVAERFPNDPQAKRTKGLVWYGISRSTMIRRWRFPKPVVPLGAEY